MPIEYRIDHNQRTVFAATVGTMTDADVFGYQREVWGDPRVAGYHELMDMTNCTDVAIRSGGRVRELATMSAAMDPPSGTSKFAIAAPGDVAYGLARMYEVYRGANSRSRKEVQVFRTMDEALKWLGVTLRAGE
jgi:hypothetical protein